MIVDVCGGAAVVSGEWRNAAGVTVSRWKGGGVKV